ncbi:MAG: D-aminoacyl-tRNA deacylase [Candidatus Sulfotelmatobacter sp.]
MVRFGLLADGVILSVAVFQAERRISGLTGLERRPNCTTTADFVRPAPVIYLLHPKRGRFEWSNHMRAVVQRVSRAQVTVQAEIVGRIALGLLVLLGVGREDTEADAIYLAEKIAGLRVFEDEQGRMNLSVKDVGGSVLAVSQFTLYGDVRRGKRPSFDEAAAPETARQLYEFFVEKLRTVGLRCETGRFQEMMKVELVNEGPVTILLDSGRGF